VRLTVWSQNGLAIKYGHIIPSAHIFEGQSVIKGQQLGVVGPWGDQFREYQYFEDHFVQHGQWGNVRADHLHLQTYYQPTKPRDRSEAMERYDPLAEKDHGFNPFLVLRPLYPLEDHEIARFKIGDDHNLSADKLFRIISLADTRDDPAIFFAKRYPQLQQLI
jgi:hypothetical protein